MDRRRLAAHGVERSRLAARGGRLPACAWTASRRRLTAEVSNGERAHFGAHDSSSVRGVVYPRAPLPNVAPVPTRGTPRRCLDAREEARAPLGGLDCLGEGVDVICALVAASVDEEGGGARYAAGIGAGDVFGYAAGVLAMAQLLREPLAVQPELLRVTDEVPCRERVLVGEEQVVVLPEPPLRRRRLARLGRELRVGVDVVEREVAPHVAQVVVVAEGGEQVTNDGLGLPAVGTLEVAVLDEGDERVLGSADVVALGVDVVGEIEDVLGRAE